MTNTETAAPTESAAEVGPESGADRNHHPITRFVQEHPALTVAGGLALGVLAAALLPKRNRALVAEKSSELAEAISAAGLMLYHEALDRAEAAGEGLRDIAEKFGETQRGRKANGDSAPDGRDTGFEGFQLQETLSGLARQLRGRPNH
jgi:hypothetical protein